jgi:hypothetical protein
MAHVRKRNGKKGLTFTITASLGYDEKGQQIRKFTTFKPPEGVTAGKAEKLANEYAVLWEERIRGYVPLNENKTIRELVEWYFESIAPMVLRPNVVAKNKSSLYAHVIPHIGNVKIKHITPQMLDALFLELHRSGSIYVLLIFAAVSVSAMVGIIFQRGIPTLIVTVVLSLAVVFFPAPQQELGILARLNPFVYTNPINILNGPGSTTALTGVVVLAAWCALFVVVGLLVFIRRDIRC